MVWPSQGKGKVGVGVANCCVGGVPHTVLVWDRPLRSKPECVSDFLFAYSLKDLS